MTLWMMEGKKINAIAEHDNRRRRYQTRAI